MEPSPSRLVLSEEPADIRIEMPSGETSQSLDPSRRLFVQLAGMPTPPGELRPYEIRVCTFGADGRHDPARLAALHELGWSGRKSFSVLFDAELGWTVEHAGHTLPIHVNGQPLYGRRTLMDGDRIEPARGLVLTFTHEKP